MFIDSHCHLFYEDFREDLPEVIARAADAGVTRFIVPATNLRTAEEALVLCDTYPGIYAAVGFHPLDLAEYSDERLNAVSALTVHPKVVAIGEIGIDYFYDTSPRELQREVFARQLALAAEKQLPVIVHTRDSVQDAIDIAARAVADHPAWREGIPRGVFHCFTGDADQARMLFGLGFLVSFPGPVTFKKSAMPEVLRQIGLDNIMVETDAPFLTPVPYRGKRNEPSYIPIIARTIAEILGHPVETVARITTRNAERLFGLPASP
ncbi:MAG: TatD family hydrolase [Bacteroidetes bacterium]|nr:TatD family hydrolase [Bacteroidota bacterium]